MCEKITARSRQTKQKFPGRVLYFKKYGGRWLGVQKRRVASGELKMSRYANQTQWYFLLLQDCERDQHTGFAMASLVTNGDYAYIEYVKAT